MIFLFLAIFCFMIHWVIRRRDGLNLLLIYLVVFCYGLYGIADFVIDVFYPTVVAQIMRWPSNTPYQFETGMANLGFGILGLFCIRFRNGFVLATIIGNSIWFWGDVVGQLMKRGWGMDLFYWSDALTPLLIWVVYFLRRKYTPLVQKGEQ